MKYQKIQKDKINNLCCKSQSDKIVYVKIGIYKFIDYN